MPPLNRIWKLVRDPAALSRALGAIESGAGDIQISTVVQPVMELAPYFPAPVIPTYGIAIQRAAAVGLFGIVEMRVLGAGDVILWHLADTLAAGGGSPLQLRFSASTAITSGTAAVTPTSFWPQYPVAQSQVLLRTGNTAAAPTDLPMVNFSGNALVPIPLPLRIPQGTFVSLIGSVVNSVIAANMVWSEVRAENTRLDE